MGRVAADASVFHAIADPTRRAILDRLRRGEESVNRLAECFAASQSACSQHLAVLRRARLVTQRREGRMHYYRLRPRPLRSVAEWLAAYDQFWQKRLEALGGYLERKRHGAK
jgi:DNA-binding transcriptional ArsR family regulator